MEHQIILELDESFFASINNTYTNPSVQTVLFELYDCMMHFKPHNLFIIHD